MGGPSGGCLGAQHLDLPVDYDSLKQAGAIMGSGGVIVMDETTCMVDLARFFVNFTQAESCGKCVPCRIGTRRMLEILTRIVSGDGTMEDLDRLEKLALTIKATSLCGLGQTAPNPVLSTLKHFRHEYEAHILEKHCVACQCEGLVKAPCSHTCPAGVDTSSYVALVAAGQFKEAMAVHLERNPFASVCGRVCHHPCEAMCKRAELDERRLGRGHQALHGRRRPELGDPPPAAARPAQARRRRRGPARRGCRAPTSSPSPASR